MGRSTGQLMATDVSMLINFVGVTVQDELCNISYVDITRDIDAMILCLNCVYFKFLYVVQPNG